MKTRNIILLALTALLTLSCHSWDDPSQEAGQQSYGNQYIQETNVVTIDALKTQYKNVINGNSLTQISKPTQLKVIVTGNDEGSNLYKQIYVADATGSICISINKGGIFSEAATGQCMLIELEGLYIGGYGKQPQIGISYTNPTKEGATPQVGRMSRYDWQEHFKLIPAIEGLNVKPVMVGNLASFNLERDCGKLVTLVGVKLKGADGKITFAPGDGSASIVGGCVNRDIEGMSNVVVRTSTYAKFAAMIMPTEKVNITGIAARYNDTWQIMPRSIDDITLTTGNEVLDITGGDTPAPAEAKGTGTKDDPFNIAAAIAKCEEVGETASTEKYYIKGIVVKGGTVSGGYGNVTFDMGDTKESTELFKAYQVAGTDGAKLADGYEVKAGDEVVIYGPVVNYKGNTPETSGKSAAQIVTINGKKAE